MQINTIPQKNSEVTVSDALRDLQALLEDAVDELLGIGAVPGLATDHKTVEDNAHGPDVDAWAQVRLTTENLRTS